MRAKRGNRRGSRTWITLVACIVAAAGAACSDTPATAPGAEESEMLAARGEKGADLVRFTGTVDLFWNGGQGAGAPNDTNRIAQGSLAAFPGIAPGSPGPGRFAFRVVNTVDSTVHREIGVELIYSHIDEALDQVWFMGVVDSDTKVCSDTPGGGGHEDGGCSHDEGSSDDGTCTHDDGTTHDEGGCSGDDGETHDGGCAGGGGEPGGPGGPGGSGSHVSGKNCRIGQYLIGTAYDGGTPGTNGDAVAWKWFAPDAGKVLQLLPAIEAAVSAADPTAYAAVRTSWPPHLCWKVIEGGNLQLLRR